MTIKDLKKHLEYFNEDDECAYDLWLLADVEYRMNERDLKFTEETGSNVLEAMESNKDANTGLSWDVMDYHIDCEVE